MIQKKWFKNIKINMNEYIHNNHIRNERMHFEAKSSQIKNIVKSSQTSTAKNTIIEQ